MKRKLLAILILAVAHPHIKFHYEATFSPKKCVVLGEREVLTLHIVYRQISLSLLTRQLFSETCLTVMHSFVALDT